MRVEKQYIFETSTSYSGVEMTLTYSKIDDEYVIHHTDDQFETVLKMDEIGLRDLKSAIDALIRELDTGEY